MAASWFNKKYSRDLAKGLSATRLFGQLQATDVLFDSNHLMVVNKRALVPSQADEHSGGRDLGYLVKQLIKSKKRTAGNVFLGTVHRLDRSASGLTCFAKTSKAAARMQQQFASGSVNKEYLAVVPGQISGRGLVPGGGSYEQHWQSRSLKDGWEDRRRPSPRNSRPDGELQWCGLAHVASMERALEEGASQMYSIIVVRITTGRKHQIRRQLASRGLPIVGDTLYGSPKKLSSLVSVPTAGKAGRNKLPTKKDNNRDRKKEKNDARNRRAAGDRFSSQAPIMLHACGLAFDNPVLPNKLPASASRQDKKKAKKAAPPERIMVSCPPPRWWRAVFKDIAIPSPRAGESYFDLAVRISDAEAAGDEEDDIDWDAWRQAMEEIGEGDDDDDESNVEDELDVEAGNRAFFAGAPPRQDALPEINIDDAELAQLDPVTAQVLAQFQAGMAQHSTVRQPVAAAPHADDQDDQAAIEEFSHTDPEFARMVAEHLAYEERTERLRRGPRGTQSE